MKISPARQEARETAQLTTYAALPDGRARIPVARAMQLIAGKSLDASPLDPVPPAGGAPFR